METNNKNNIILRTGLYSSLAMLVLTVVVFAFAMIAIPPSGPNCPGNCMTYPYPDILKYFPRDYYWMCTAIFQLCAFLVFIIANHFNAPEGKKIFSFISIAFALISVSVLLTDYFIQFAVIPISLMKGEAEGIELLTQYNGHGIFIAMEELGYFMMSISFVFLAPVFSLKNRLEKSLRIIYLLQFAGTVLSFITYSIIYGLDRDYRFEVAVITIIFLVMIITGILMSLFYKQKIKREKEV